MLEIEKELLLTLDTELGDVLVVEPTSIHYFERLASRFPVVGSKIDWRQVPGERTVWVDAQDANAFRAEGLEFMDDVLNRMRLPRDTELLVIGDGPMDSALRVPAGSLSICLSHVLDMPQHTYVLPADAAWCVSFTMEGYISFGQAVH